MTDIVDPFAAPQPAAQGGIVDPFDQNAAPAPQPRSALGEIGTAAKAGALIDLPHIVGQAAKYVTGGKFGQGAVDFAQQEAQRPDLQPQEAQHGPITNFLAKGARMAPVVGPAIVAGALAPEGVIPTAIGMAAGGLPFALSAGQDTYEKAKAAGQSEQEAVKAGREAAAVNAAAMSVVPAGVGAVARGVIGAAARGGVAATAEDAAGQLLKPPTIGSALAKGAASDFAANTAMGVAQGAGQAAVEKEHGISTQSPWEAAKEQLLPSAGAALLFGPLSYLHASKAVQDGTVKAQAIQQTLANADAHPLARAKAAGIVYQAMQKADPNDANMWRINATEAIKQKAPIGLDSSWMKGPHPSVFPETAGLLEAPKPIAAGSEVPSQPDTTGADQHAAQVYAARQAEEDRQAALAPISTAAAESSPKLLAGPAVSPEHNLAEPQIGEDAGLPPYTQQQVIDTASAHANAIYEARAQEEARLQALASHGPISAAAAEGIRSGLAGTKMAERQEAIPQGQTAKPGEAVDENIAAWTHGIPGESLADAQATAQRYRASGKDFQVVPHPDGGYAVMPAELVSPELQKQHAGLQTAKVPEAPSLMPFATPEVAQKRASDLTSQSGVEHEVIPHPAARDKFAVQPKAPEPVQEAAPAAEPEQPVAEQPKEQPNAETVRSDQGQPGQEREVVAGRENGGGEDLQQPPEAGRASGNEQVGSAEGATKPAEEGATAGFQQGEVAQEEKPAEEAKPEPEAAAAPEKPVKAEGAAAVEHKATAPDSVKTLNSYFSRDKALPVHVVMDKDGTPVNWSVNKKAVQKWIDNRNDAESRGLHVERMTEEAWNAKSANARKAEAAPEAKLHTDVGEKIGGARKDRWRGRGLNVSDLEEIRRVRARIEQLQSAKAQLRREVPFDGGKAVDDVEGNRLRVYFDAKPDEATRAKLRANGFKWAPSEGAWQRFRGPMGEAALQRALGVKFDAAGEPPAFKLGPREGGQTAESIQKSLTPIIRQWRNAPKIRVVQSITNLPADVPANTRGYYRDGMVHLVADNIKDAKTAQFVLLHEVVGHYGLRGVFGDSLKPLLQRIYDTNPDIRAEADRQIAKAAQSGLTYDTALGTEEALSDRAGKGLGDISGWKMLVAAIRNGLRKLGFNIAMSDNDIEAMLAKSREFVGRRSSSVTQAMNEAAPAYSVDDNAEPSRPSPNSGLGDASVRRVGKMSPFIERALADEGAYQVSVSGGNVDELRKIARGFGKEIVFFRADSSLATGGSADAGVHLPSGGSEPVARGNEEGNIVQEPGQMEGATWGFVNPGNVRQVFLNVDSGNHLLYILGHELSHTMRAEDAALWHRMGAELAPLIRDKWPQYLRDTDYTHADLKDHAEELFGDLIGQHFADREFWREIANASPRLFHRLAGKAIGLINRALRPMMDRNASQYVSDLKQARAVISKTLIEYAGNARMGLYRGFADEFDPNYLNKQRLESRPLFSLKDDDGDERTVRPIELEPKVTGGKAAESEAQFTKSGKIVREKGVGPQPVDKAIPKWLHGADPKVVEAARKAGAWVESKPLKQRIREQKHEAGLRVLQAAVDQYASIQERLGDMPYKLARMSSAYDAGVETLLHYGQIRLNSAGAIERVPDSKGVLDILKPLQGEADRFMMWMAGQRADRLSKEDREHNFGQDDISALKGLNGKLHADDNLPDGSDGKGRTMLYAKVAKEFMDVQKSMLDLAVKAGTLTPELRDTYANQFYVPFYREAEDGRSAVRAGNISGLVNQYFSKRLKGGDGVLHDLLANTVQNWSHLVQSSLKNNAATKILEAAEAQGYAHKLEGLKADAKEAGFVPKELAPTNTVFILKDGKPVHYVIDDPLLLDSVSALGASPFRVPKYLAWFKHALTVGTTMSPIFRVRHTIREQIASLILGHGSYNPVKNWIDGFKYSSRNNPEYGNMLAGGSFFRMGYGYEDNRGAYFKQLLAHDIDTATVLDSPTKVKRALEGAWDWWKETGERSDSITRANRYRNTYAEMIAAGKSPDEAHFEASYAARSTLDYGLHGTSAAIKMITGVVPFMNARLQGLYVIGKALHADRRRFATVVGGVTLATMALTLAYRDDKDMQAREEWDRDNNWAFRVGDKIFRIPKPFELGAIATVADRALEVALNGFDPADRERFADRILPIICSQLNINPIASPLIAAPLQIWGNKDWFTGRSIETERELNLQTADRIGPNTSAIAQLAGKAGILSPEQIDFAVNQFFGWVGVHAVMTADLALRPMMGLPDKPSPRVNDIPVIGDFVHDLPQNQSRFTEAFYKHLIDVQMAFGSMRELQKTGQTEKLVEALKDNRNDIVLHGLYQRTQRQLGRLNTQERYVNMRNLAPDEKRLELDRIAQIKNRLTETAEMMRAQQLSR